MGAAFLVALIATVGNVVVMPTPAQAEDDPAVRHETYRRSLFSSYMRTRTGADARHYIKDMVVSADMLGYRQRNPNATPDQITRYSIKRAQFFASQLTPGDPHQSMHEFYMKILQYTAMAPGAGEISKIMADIAESTVGKQIKANGDINNQIHAAQEYRVLLNGMQQAQNLIWQQVATLGKEDATFNAAWTGLIGAKYNTSANVWATELEADPVLATYVNVNNLQEVISNNGELESEVDRQHKELLDKIATQTAEANRLLKEMNERFPLQGAAQPTQSDFDQAKAAAAERQKWLDGAAGAVELLATLAGFVNKRAGDIIRGTGRAALQIASAINSFLPTIAAKGLPAALFSASGIGMAATVLGAVSSLVPLFGSAGPTLDEQILEQLRELRLEIRDFRTEMNQRFDAIETALVKIYEQLDVQFENLLRQSIYTQAQLEQIITQLALVTEKVDYWGLALYRSLQETYKNQVKYLINDNIDFVDIKSREMTQPEYESAADGFQKAAAIDSRTGTMTATPGVPQLEAELDRAGYQGSVAYLNQYARDYLNLPATEVSVNVPAIEHWLAAAQGYKVLLAQNPVQSKQVFSRTESVVAAGNAIQEAVRQFSKPQGSDQPQRLNPLFVTLLDDYRNTGLAMAKNMQEKRASIQGDRSGYSMFQRPDQTLVGVPQTPAPAEVSYCDSSEVPYKAPRPSNVTFPYGERELWVADYGRPNTPVQMCYEAEWVNVTVWGNPENEEKPSYQTGDLKVTFKVRQVWDGQPIVVSTQQRVYTYGRFQQYNPWDPSQTWSVEPFQAMQAKWNSTYRASFEQGAEYKVVDLAILKDKVRNWLYGQAGQYYVDVVKEMQTPGTSLHNLNTKLTRTALLLQVYTKLGFARSLEYDQTIGVHLLGKDRIPFDQGTIEAAIVGGAPRSQVLAPFVQARNNYCEGITGDGKCVLKPKNPDPAAEPSPTLNLTPFPCASPEQERVDPLERCFNHSVDSRSTQLRKQLEAASLRIATNADFQEGIPEVDVILDGIEVAELYSKGNKLAPPVGEIIGLAGKCLDVRHAGTADGTQIQIYSCNGTPAQAWAMMSNNTVMAMGKCLDVNQGASADGTRIQLWTCHGLGSQLWKPQADGTLRNPQSGKCLDVQWANPAEGTAVQLYTCNTTDAQRWTLPTAA
ncbi:MULTISPECIES: RICIN domain-containing protein [unclassified Micromonospora]|uniref:RICIN domain-containing protein n=1 Tax=unclassified Micromonospora TaxID=2617518 RepID=UPI0036304870